MYYVYKRKNSNKFGNLCSENVLKLYKFLNYTSVLSFYFYLIKLYYIIINIYYYMYIICNNYNRQI